MGYTSDEAVERIAKDIVVNRQKRREIQSMTKDELQRYLISVYRYGFESGAEAIEKHLAEKAKIDTEDDTEEISIGWEDVLEVIATVKGIGPKMIRAIDDKLKEAY